MPNSLSNVLDMASVLCVSVGAIAFGTVVAVGTVLAFVGVFLLFMRCIR